MRNYQKKCISDHSSIFEAFQFVFGRENVADHGQVIVTLRKYTRSSVHNEFRFQHEKTLAQNRSSSTFSVQLSNEDEFQVKLSEIKEIFVSFYSNIRIFSGG